jgi:4-hydroxyphenylacetate 3-monooxygenase
MATQEIQVPQANDVRPYTGEEYLDSLRDGREVWIYGERVQDVTVHPAFRNSARSIAGLYDSMHTDEAVGTLAVPTDTGNGGFTHPFFRVAHTKDDLRASRDAIAAWQRQVFGWMGRTPDYKASLLGTMGANPDFFGEYAENAQRWYRDGQERMLFLGHALVHPPVDRSSPPEEVGDVYVHVDEETDEGLIVSGAKVVATGAVFSNYTFVGHYGLPLKEKRFGVSFMAPMNAPGVKLLCRASYEQTAAQSGHPFDYPLSSRFDENDSIIVFDRALIPWDCVLIYDAERANAFNGESGWISRAHLHGITRLVIKLEFLAGLFSRATNMVGNRAFRTVQANLGEVIAYRNMFAGLMEGMIAGAVQDPSAGRGLLPSPSVALAFQVFSPHAYVRIKEIFQEMVGSGLIYLNSGAVDFQTPEMRPYLDRFMRGSQGKTAEDRSKLMKLFWDAIGTEFGGRHELYEINYLGANEVNKLFTLQEADADGSLARFEEFVETCMSQYDLNGWVGDKYVQPDDVKLLRSGFARS